MTFVAHEFVQSLRKKIKDSRRNKTAFYADFEKEGLGIEEKAAAFDAMVRELYDQEENIRIDLIREHAIRLDVAERDTREIARLGRYLDEEQRLRKEASERARRKLAQMQKKLDAAVGAASFKPLGFVVRRTDQGDGGARCETEDQARQLVIDSLSEDPTVSLQVLAVMAEVQAKWLAPAVEAKPKRTRVP